MRHGITFREHLDMRHYGTWGKSSFIPVPYSPFGGNAVGLCPRSNETFPSRAVDSEGGAVDTAGGAVNREIDWGGE